MLSTMIVESSDDGAKKLELRSHKGLLWRSHIIASRVVQSSTIKHQHEQSGSKNKQEHEKKSQKKPIPE